MRCTPPWLILNDMETEPAVTVSIHSAAGGGWDVVVGQARDHIAFATFDNARSVAYRAAAAGPPCELFARGSYHRVVHREIIDRDRRGLESPPA
jgi:hypothetical protein